MKCPRCNSDRINVSKRDEKVSLFGATLNNELVAICQECGKTFDPELAYLNQKIAEAKQNLSDICSQKLQKILAVEKLDFTVTNFPHGFFAAPDIPEKKLLNAISAYAHSVQKNEILFLVDLSLLGSAKDGIVITSQKLYYKNLGKYYAIALNTISLCDIKCSKLLINELTLEVNSGARAKLLLDIIKQLMKKCNNSEGNTNTNIQEYTSTESSTIANNETASISSPNKGIKKWGCGCLAVFIIFLIIIASCTKTEKIKEEIEVNFDKWMSNWLVEDAKYKLVEDNEFDCLKMVIIFKGNDLPNNITKLLERISESVGMRETQFLVECVVENNSTLVLHKLHWENTSKHRVYAILNPVAENIEQDKERVEKARKENILLCFKDNLSGWDGSLPTLVFAVKDTMHNPSSFEHVKTLYAVHSYEGEGEVIVTMTFRGTNAYGAVVTQTVKVICTPNGKILRTID